MESVKNGKSEEMEKQSVRESQIELAAYSQSVNQQDEIKTQL